MDEYEGKTTEQVLQEVREGKRLAVVHPGPHESDGIRAHIVIADWPWHYPLGSVDNLDKPGMMPPLFFSNKRDEAERQAEEWNARMGIQPKEACMIVMSSMLAQDNLRSVRVKRDMDSDEATLFTGDGTELCVLDGKYAARLYEQLAEAYGWVFNPVCPSCLEELDEGKCSNCQEE
jgi:hypothetical protein